jgi:serine/threonine protein kinase
MINVLGSGKDGCIIDSFEWEDFSPKNGFVAKLLRQDIKLDKKLHEILHNIDPNGERYSLYYFSTKPCTVTGLVKNHENIYNLISNYGFFSQVVFQKRLIPLEPKRLTTIQYRYLRRSLEILHENGICHGDLPGNVMMDPNDGMPRIIDWENAFYRKKGCFTYDILIDNSAFFTHFSVLK